MTSGFVFIGEMILRRNVPSLEFGSSKLNSISLATFPVVRARACGIPQASV